MREKKTTMLFCSTDKNDEKETFEFNATEKWIERIKGE